jgi:nicotinamide-nucleotide amidase
VPESLLRERAAYDPEVARCMADGALERTPEAGLAIAITGVAGPGPDQGKPPGLVYIAAAHRGRDTVVEEIRYT